MDTINNTLQTILTPAVPICVLAIIYKVTFCVSEIGLHDIDVSIWVMYLIVTIIYV